MEGTESPEETAIREVLEETGVKGKILAPLGHQLLSRLSPAEVDRLMMAVLTEIAKVFDFNMAHDGKLGVSIDGRISNWAVIGQEPTAPALPDPLELRYLDVGTPLMMRDGVEQYAPEPLLRSFPVVLRPFLRRVLLPDMMVRYYNYRRVTLDLLTSILNAGHNSLLRMLVDSANWFFLAERQEMHFRPITVHEVFSYHRRDMRRWQLYLALQRQRGETTQA
ncbi:MAG: NUDIX domain-containing protein [Anaerolineae bacterium]|nr:NUDIX domain-containing protein [Anaerolineae bacterium]